MARYQEPLDTRLSNGTLTICLPPGSVGDRLGRRAGDGLVANARRFEVAESGDWRKSAPACIAGDVYEAADLEQAASLAAIQLDLISEGQDGTEQFTKRDVQAIRNWLKSIGRS